MTFNLFFEESVDNIFKIVGFITIGYTTWNLAHSAINNLLTFTRDTKYIDFKKYGTWAVVTGCTDGIGKAYVDKLAQCGLNIVLISRNSNKLNNQSIELQNKYPSIETIIIVADFTEPDIIYGQIQKKVSNLDIAVLVNNVGMTYLYPEYYHIISQSNKLVSDFINCNITSVAKMTAIILPHMVEKNKGIIINNACFTGRIPIPFLSIYSSSKAFVDFFSRSLALEYEKSGIIIQSLCPYFVSTKISHLRSNLLVPKPGVFVNDSLKTIKLQKITNGTFLHNLQGWFYESFFPSSLFYYIIKKLLLNTREKAIEKFHKMNKIS